MFSMMSCFIVYVKNGLVLSILSLFKYSYLIYPQFFSYEVPTESKETTKAIEELTEYHDDWLLPELAAEILTIIFTDESGIVTPQNKIDAFRILYSKYSKNLRFGTTLGESFHPAILKHLQQIDNCSHSSKVEVRNV